MPVFRPNAAVAGMDCPNGLRSKKALPAPLDRSSIRLRDVNERRLLAGCGDGLLRSTPSASRDRPVALISAACPQMNDPEVGTSSALVKNSTTWLGLGLGLGLG